MGCPGWPPGLAPIARYRGAAQPQEVLAAAGRIRARTKMAENPDLVLSRVECLGIEVCLRRMVRQHLLTAIASMVVASTGWLILLLVSVSD